MNRRCLMVIVAVIYHTLSAGLFAASANDKSSVINLKADDIAASGFTMDENLITTTNTINKGYSNCLNLDAASNNNICEPDTDSLLQSDNISNGDLSGLWVTWDTNFLYVAIQGQVEGSINNTMCFLDTNADLGIEHQDSLYPGAWLRDISFNEGIRPNAYVGMWCQNNTANFYGSDAFGNAQLHYAESASIFWSIRANGTVSSNLFSAWYNGSTQFEPPKRLFMFKMHWSYLTNVNVVPTVTSLTLRIAVVSTGPVDGSPIFDVLPDHGFELDYSYVLLNNYFSIPITDGSGNLLIGTSPRSTADINFYPGSRNEPIISKPVLVSPVNGATNIALDAAFTLIPASHTKSLALTHRLFLSTNSNFAGVTPILLTARPAGVMVAGLGILFFMTAGMVIPFGSRKRRLLVMLATFCLFAGFAVLSSCSDDADVPGEITYTGASLESGKTYYWKVSATDPNGFYRTSDVSTFTAH